jgi:hypothetical protein
VDGLRDLSYTRRDHGSFKRKSGKGAKDEKLFFDRRSYAANAWEFECGAPEILTVFGDLCA